MVIVRSLICMYLCRLASHLLGKSSYLYLVLQMITEGLGYMTRVCMMQSCFFPSFDLPVEVGQIEDHPWIHLPVFLVNTPATPVYSLA